MLAVKPHLLILLLFVALATRGGWHLHLCFDGSEPAVSLHAADHVTHHAGMSGMPSHEDADVFISGSALPRLDDSVVHLPVLLATLLLVSLLLLPQAGARPVGRLPLPALTPPRSRPPTRGPPPALSH